MSFAVWMSQVEEEYKKLSDAEKIATLERLIECSQPAQLTYLHTRLSGFLTRDFLVQLPRELVHQLLYYLDMRSLLVCCQVSRAWNDIVTSCEARWKLACANNGLRDTGEEQSGWGGGGYKSLWQRSRAVLCGLSNRSAIESHCLFGHLDRVMAIYYYNGELATGSDDRFVRIWDCETGQCERVFRAHTVADLKFNDTILLTGSFDTTAALWNVHSGQLIQRFEGHVAAVFSIDFAEDILVTGSADSTVRLWDMSMGTALKVLSQHRSAWITNVRLEQNPDGRFVTLSRDNTVVYMWQFERQQNDVVILDHCELSVHTDNIDLLPGLHIRDNKVQFAGFRASTCSYCIIETNLDDLEAGCECKSRVREVVALTAGSDIQAYMYLGSGSQFDVFLVDDNKHIPRLEIFRRRDKIASIEISSRYRSSKRGSTFTLGNTAWLDGFYDDCIQGVIFAASLKDNSVYFLSWKDCIRHSLAGLEGKPRFDSLKCGAGDHSSEQL